MHKTMLVVFSGLPGVGKTAIAREVAKRLSFAYLRVDSLEHALAASGVIALGEIAGGGYQAAAALAVDNLRNRLSVVVDCVNPWPLTRRMFEEAAKGAGCEHVGVECVCSDASEHRRRVENRRADIPGFPLPTWEEVLARDYRPWHWPDLSYDTSKYPVEESVQSVMNYILHRKGGIIVDDGGTIRIKPLIGHERPKLLEVWQRSVRATHHFLTENDIETLRPEVERALKWGGLVWVLDIDGTPSGFLIQDGAMVEALFIDPLHAGKGFGTALLNHARLMAGPDAILRVDVNEDNPDALGFYLARGFQRAGRSETDHAGRPFPLLHLEQTPS